MEKTFNENNVEKELEIIDPQTGVAIGIPKIKISGTFTVGKKSSNPVAYNTQSSDVESANFLPQ